MRGVRWPPPPRRRTAVEYNNAGGRKRWLPDPVLAGPSAEPKLQEDGTEGAWRATLHALAGEGHHHRGASAWTAAAQAWHNVGNPWWRARCLIFVAESTAQSDRQQAAALLGEARTIAEALRAVTLLGDADALAARARLGTVHPPPQAAAAGSRGLQAITARERQVLAGLAAGATNRNIARSLFISERTVAVHVSNLLAKLHARNGGEAAAIAYRLNLLSPPPPEEHQ